MSWSLSVLFGTINHLPVETMRHSNILITTNLVPDESSSLIPFKNCLDYSQSFIFSQKFLESAHH